MVLRQAAVNYGTNTYVKICCYYYYCVCSSCSAIDALSQAGAAEFM